MNSSVATKPVQQELVKLHLYSKRPRRSLGPAKMMSHPQTRPCTSVCIRHTCKWPPALNASLCLNKGKLN